MAGGRNSEEDVEKRGGNKKCEGEKGRREQMGNDCGIGEERGQRGGDRERRGDWENMEGGVGRGLDDGGEEAESGEKGKTGESEGKESRDE